MKKYVFVVAMLLIGIFFGGNLQNVFALDLSDYNGQNFTRTEGGTTHTYTDLIYGRAVGYWWVGFFDRTGITINSASSSSVDMYANGGSYIAVYQCQGSYADCSFSGYSNWITNPVDHSSYDFGAGVNVDIDSNYTPPEPPPPAIYSSSGPYTDSSFLSSYSSLGVADWTTLVQLRDALGTAAVTSIFENLNIPVLTDCSVESQEASCLRVLNDGELAYGGNRYYFACYNEGNTIQGFSVFSSIDNQVILGGWYGMNMKALVSTPANGMSVSRNPETGGGVVSLPEGDGIYCGVDSYEICQMNFAVDSEVELEAYPATGWAFAYWDDGTNQYTDNPHTFTMDSAKTVTAKFFRTFRNAVGDFKREIDDTGGWCTEYVNYETDSAFTGNAAQWLENAFNAGYRTGSTPASGAIAVFDSDTIPPYGHVAIVTGDTYTSNGHVYLPIRDSNWCDPYCFQVKQHDMDITNNPVLGYIYYAP